MKNKAPKPKNTNETSGADTAKNTDIEVSVKPINPKAATKTNKKLLKNLEKFTPKHTTESGKSVYHPEDRQRILDQLNKLLSKGHNLTMTKKALAMYHNVNTGTLDSWRKTSKIKNENTESITTHKTLKTSTTPKTKATRLETNPPAASDDTNVVTADLNNTAADQVTDDEYFAIIKKKLDSIEEEIRVFEKRVQEAKELLANEDKLRKELETKREDYLPPAFKRRLGE